MVLGGDRVCCMGSVSTWVVVMGRFYKKDDMGSSKLAGEVSGGVTGSSLRVLEDVDFELDLDLDLALVLGIWICLALSFCMVWSNVVGEAR